MRSLINYIKGFFSGLWSLLVGMITTLRIFFRKKTTECYPENSKTLQIFERFRGELTLIHNEKTNISVLLAAFAKSIARTIPFRWCRKK